MNPVPKSVEWIGGPEGHLRLLDQTRLPSEVVFRDCHTPEEVWLAIKELAVRGAPAIGIAAAYGVVLGIQPLGTEARENISEKIRQVAESLMTSRPTAVNLFWACERMIRVANEQ